MKGARVAVVGGGIFGTTAAIRLARDGHRVTLFERRPTLLAAASGINQYRLHRGYHYPRSLATALECRNGEPEFRREYAGAVVDDFTHHYALARHGSLTTPADYLAFLRHAELEHEQIDALPFLRMDNVALVIRAREAIFDPAALREIVAARLTESGVEVRVGAAAAAADVAGFDVVVIATYAALNALLGERERRVYQFEVCEKLVVRPPPSLAGQSLVVMDGPFFCIDPVGRTGLSVVGNVVHALHATNDGFAPQVPPPLRALLDRGTVPASEPALASLTRFTRFVGAAAEFVPDLSRMEHVGSMFTVRTVLPNVHATDERRTVVSAVSDRVITLFSGKIDSCVAAADTVATMLSRR